MKTPIHEVLADLEGEGKSTWALLNKWDAVGEDQIIEARHLHTRFPSGVQVFEISAASGAGLEELARAVFDITASRFKLLVMMENFRVFFSDQ